MKLLALLLVLTACTSPTAPKAVPIHTLCTITNPPIQDGCVP